MDKTPSFKKSAQVITNALQKDSESCGEGEIRFEGTIGLSNFLGGAHSKSNCTNIFQRYQSNYDQLESLLVNSLRNRFGRSDRIYWTQYFN